MNGYRVFRDGSHGKGWLVATREIGMGFWVEDESKATAFPLMIAEIEVGYWRRKLPNETIEMVPVAIEE